MTDGAATSGGDTAAAVATSGGGLRLHDTYTGAVREFTAQPVTDETLARILETARFAPNGGNAQSWHVVVVRDPHSRRRMAELYRRGWYDYVAMREAGLRPWAPTNDRDDERGAVTAADQVAARGRADPGFAENFADVPVMLAVVHLVNRSKDWYEAGARLHAGV